MYCTYVGCECAGSHSFLLASSIDLRVESHLGLAADVKCSNSLGAIHFVTTNAHHVNFRIVHIDGNFTDTLRCVGVEEDFALAADFSQL